MRTVLLCLLTGLGVQTGNWLYRSRVGVSVAALTKDAEAAEAAAAAAAAKHAASEQQLNRAQARMADLEARLKRAVSTAAEATAAAAAGQEGAKQKQMQKGRRQPRVLCFVPVGPPPEPEGGITLRAIMRTWGQRCDGLVFLGPVGYELATPRPTEEQQAAATALRTTLGNSTAAAAAALPRPFPAAGYATLKVPRADTPPWQTQPLVVEEVKGCIEPTKRIDRDDGGRLWRCMHRVWWHVFERYGDKFDWFLKVDDDTVSAVSSCKQALSHSDAISMSPCVTDTPRVLAGRRARRHHVLCRSLRSLTTFGRWPHS